MRRIVFIMSIFLWVSKIQAQDTAIVKWELSSGVGGAYQTQGALVGVNQNVSDEYLIYGYGGTKLSQQAYASGGDIGYWPNETSENTDRYCEFKAFPRKGVSFQLSDIAMKLGGDGSNKFMVNIYYSTDDFQSSTILSEGLVLPLDELNDLSFNLSAHNIVVEDQGMIQIRVYPWLFGGEKSGMYFNIRDVQITGTLEGEVIPDLPVVASAGIDKLSTQNVIFRGILSDDGGVTLDSLGVAFGTSENPDVNDYVVLVTPEKGYFEAKIDSILPGTQYYARAFAINGAGVSYGYPIAFKTLDSLSVPGITTIAVDHVSYKGAVAYGKVYFDGGLEVSLTGFCYSKQVSPTVSDFVVNEGKGLGAFNTYLNEVDAGQTYYVRAFAQNTEGVGYGQQVEFKTPDRQPDINYIVDQNGNGDFTTLQAAFDALPLNYQGKIKIFVRNGMYSEKVILQRSKINVHLLGENRDSTIIQWDDYSGRVVGNETIGTSTSYTIAIDADDFMAQDISFQNTSETAQAVAVRIKGDRMIFNHCNFLGYQDTYYTWGRGRVYHEDCYIEGTVDFIFGSSVAIFKNCLINSKRNSPVTAANTEQGYKFGYVFDSCKLIADADITKATLGRPWRPFAQTVFMNSELGIHIKAQGWSEWNGNNNHLTCYYAEYNNFGEGLKPDSRVEWSHQLTDEEAEKYTMDNIFAKETAHPDYAYDWMPVFNPLPVDEDTTTNEPVFIINNKNISSVIYPNPANDFVNVEYSLNESMKVNIAFYSIDGKMVKQVQNTMQNSGNYKYAIRVLDMNPGVYICKAILGKKQVNQILILK